MQLVTTLKPPSHTRQIIPLQSSAFLTSCSIFTVKISSRHLRFRLWRMLCSTSTWEIAQSQIQAVRQSLPYLRHPSAWALHQKPNLLPRNPWTMTNFLLRIRPPAYHLSTVLRLVIVRMPSFRHSPSSVPAGTHPRRGSRWDAPTKRVASPTKQRRCFGGVWNLKREPVFGIGVV